MDELGAHKPYGWHSGRAGRLLTPRAPQVDELGAALNARMRGAEEDLGNLAGDLAVRVTELEEAVAELADVPAAVQAVEAALAGVPTALAALQARPPAAAPSARACVRGLV